MANYIIYFNQNWVGNHESKWYESRGPLARQVVEEMRQAGVLVFAGGLEEEIEKAIGVKDSGEITEPITNGNVFLGGLTIINVENDEQAKLWGTKIGRACGWPQEIRKFKGD